MVFCSPNNPKSPKTVTATALLCVGAHAGVAHHADGHAGRQTTHAHRQACLGMKSMWFITIVNIWLLTIYGTMWYTYS